MAAAASRYDPLPATAGRMRSFELLHSRLVEHAQLYETGELQDQRDAIAASMIDIADYLSARGVPNASQRPLWRVVEALVERERGGHDPLFTERANRSKGGRPEKPVRNHQQAGVVAAFAKFWIEHHSDKSRPIREQFAEIARLLDNSGLGELNAAKVKQARELVSRESANHPARGMYDVVLGWLERSARDYGAENAISILLPMVVQFQLIWRD